MTLSRLRHSFNTVPHSSRTFKMRCRRPLLNYMTWQEAIVCISEIPFVFKLSSAQAPFIFPYSCHSTRVKQHGFLPSLILLVPCSFCDSLLSCATSKYVAFCSSEASLSTHSFLIRKFLAETPFLSERLYDYHTTSSPQQIIMRI